MAKRLFKIAVQATCRLVIILIRRLVIWTRHHPQLAATTYLVLAIHIVALCFMTYRSPQTTVLQTRNNVVVQTVTLKPPPIVVAPKPKPTPKVNPKPVAKKKPEQKKKTAASKPKPKPKKVVAKQEAPKPNLRQKQLLKQALANLDKVDNKPAATIPVLRLDTSESPHDKGIDPRDLGYCEELIQRLQLLLRLPEYGEVRVKLTLRRDGTVADLEVLDTKSAINKEYVMKTLPTNRFPPFTTHFSGEAQHSFILALANE